MHQQCRALTPANHAAAVPLASVPDEIRGYGHVKDKSMAEAAKLRMQRLLAFRHLEIEPAAVVD